MTDITIPLSGVIVNFRVGAIIHYEDRVLICRLPDKNWWYVPGGRIAVGESSHEALSRELSEEISGKWEIGSPVASSENFFKVDDKEYQEVCLYYAVNWLSEPMDLSSHSYEVFKWVTINSINDYIIKPDFVKSLFIKQEKLMCHIIHRDNEEVAQPEV